MEGSNCHKSYNMLPEYVHDGKIEKPEATKWEAWAKKSTQSLASTHKTNLANIVLLCQSVSH